MGCGCGEGTPPGPVSGTDDAEGRDRVYGLLPWLRPALEAPVGPIAGIAAARTTLLAWLDAQRATGEVAPCGTGAAGGLAAAILEELDAREQPPPFAPGQLLEALSGTGMAAGVSLRRGFPSAAESKRFLAEAGTRRIEVSVHRAAPDLLATSTGTTAAPRGEQGTPGTGGEKGEVRRGLVR